jgi:hypothetical protein
MNAIEARFREAPPSEGILAELGSIPAGPVLTAYLMSVDRARLNGHQLVDVLQAQARQLAHAQAEFYAIMREVSWAAPSGPDGPVLRDPEMLEFATGEIQAALTMTRRAADAELELAWGLTDRLPGVGEALRQGHIDLRRARTILNGTSHLEEDLARQVADRVLEVAAELTSGQLAARVRKLCIELDTEAAAEMLKEGLEERAVVGPPTRTAPGTSSPVICPRSGSPPSGNASTAWPGR